MSNEKYISDEEINIIEKIQIDKEIEKKINKRNEVIINNKLLSKAMENVICDLKAGEYIEEYIIGVDYKVEKVRMMGAGVGLFTSHPIFGWSEKLVLIRSNKRLLIMEVGQYFSYIKHYEVKKEITIHKDKESIYFVVNTLDGKEKALQSFLDEREELIDKIADENIKVNYSNERFNCEEKEILKKESILLGIIFAIIMIAWIIKQVQMFL